MLAERSARSKPRRRDPTWRLSRSSGRGTREISHGSGAPDREPRGRAPRPPPRPSAPPAVPRRADYSVEFRPQAAPRSPGSARRNGVAKRQGGATRQDGKAEDTPEPQGTTAIRTVRRHGVEERRGRTVCRNGVQERCARTVRWNDAAKPRSGAAGGTAPRSGAQHTSCTPLHNSRTAPVDTRQVGARRSRYKHVTARTVDGGRRCEERPPFWTPRARKRLRTCPNVQHELTIWRERAPNQRNTCPGHRQRAADLGRSEGRIPPEALDLERIGPHNNHS